MTVLTTNPIGTKLSGRESKPIPLRHVRVDDLKVRTQFDFTAGQFKEVRPHASAFGRGPLQTSQLREMAENKARLAAAAAKKAALAQAAVAGKPRKAKGRKRSK